MVGQTVEQIVGVEVSVFVLPIGHFLYLILLVAVHLAHANHGGDPFRVLWFHVLSRQHNQMQENERGDHDAKRHERVIDHLQLELRLVFY